MIPWAADLAFTDQSKARTAGRLSVRWTEPRAARLGATLAQV